MVQHHHTDNHPDVLTPTEARQARPGRPVLYVLVASLILVMVAWGVMELVY